MMKGSPIPHHLENFLTTPPGYINAVDIDTTFFSNLHPSEGWYGLEDRRLAYSNDAGLHHRA